ncbi:hypothetical protein QUF90_11125 [Desulfococcaceae bacterium HSG9]|nr:hypothetical protein [Desulfococcaceae bacterium HSG9]
MPKGKTIPDETLESETEFQINFESGSRTLCTPDRLVNRLEKAGKRGDDHILKVTADKQAAYKNALTNTNIMSDIPYIYPLIVWQRVKRRRVTVEKFSAKGTADDFSGKTMNTSFIERFNLTLRRHVSYLQRKTSGYCKIGDPLFFGAFFYYFQHFGLQIGRYNSPSIANQFGQTDGCKPRPTPDIQNCHT